jgi:hypothetical protein
MICKSCGTQNLTTSMRCIQCGTALLNEASESSSAYRDGARAVDRRMYGGIGSFIGFFLTFFVLKFVLEDLYLDAREIYGGALGASIIGGIIGRLLANSKWKNS